MMFAIIGALAFVGGVGWIFYSLFIAVPDFTLLKRAVDVPIELASGDKAVRRIGPAAPGWVAINQVSPHLLKAVVASEDSSFFQHQGVDFFEIQEALKQDLKEKRFARGASTITQQVVKNAFLDNDKNLWRKVKEFFWAQQMERVLTKTEILAFYVNMVEMGPGIYGVRQASQYYFGTQASTLSPKQSAFLTMLLPSPKKYHNANFIKRTLTPWAGKRVARILHVMHKMRFINDPTYEAALAESLWGEAGLTKDESGDDIPTEDPSAEEAPAVARPDGSRPAPGETPVPEEPTTDSAPPQTEEETEVTPEESPKRNAPGQPGADAGAAPESSALRR